MAILLKHLFTGLPAVPIASEYVSQNVPVDVETAFVGVQHERERSCLYAMDQSLVGASFVIPIALLLEVSQ